MIALQEPKDMYTMAELRKANEAERGLRESPDVVAWHDRNYTADPEEDRGDYGW